MQNFTLEQIVLGLKKGELKCQEKEKKSSSSEVWTSFNEIIDMQEQLTGFVICINCEHIFKYNYKSGTSTLKRHKCPSNESNRKLLHIGQTKISLQLLRI